MALGTARSLAVVVALLLASVPIRSAGMAMEVPFELYQQHLVVVRGAIGGLDRMKLLIDTGTIPSVVDYRVAKKLRLETGPSKVVAFGQETAIRAATIEGFTFGPVRSGPVPVMVGDLAYVDRVQLDAIVGLDVLARSSFTIDYRKKTLSLGSAPEGTGVAMELIWPFATVRMTIGGQPVRLMVDTGSSDLVLFKTRMPPGVSDAAWKGDKIVTYASGPARLKRMELPGASLGTTTWDALPAWSLDGALDGYPPEVDGVLGVRALACERVRLDFERSEFGCAR